MKFLLIALVFAIFSPLSAQTVQESFEKAFEAHSKGDFEKAIENYLKVIALKPSHQYAQYNLAACYQATGNFEAAIRHFKLENQNAPFSKAYYGIATSYAQLQNIDEAIANADSTLMLDSAMTDCYNLRGQLLMTKGDTAGACRDFGKSAQAGDKNAARFYERACSENSRKEESFVFDFPKNEKWIKASSQNDGGMIVTDYIPEGQTLDSWNQLVNLMVLPGMTGIDFEKTMEMMLTQAKERSETATLTFVEKDLNAPRPYIIFKIESPGFKGDEKPESQLWYLTEGLQGVYFSFRAIKAATISEAQKKEWTAFLKRSRFEYK